MAIEFTLVRPCPVRLGMAQQGFIRALRGLASYGTVLSCPVMQGFVEQSSVVQGIFALGIGPAGSSDDWFCKAQWGLARHFKAMFGLDGRGTPVWDLPLQFREVLSGVAGRGGARHRMARRGLALSWSGTAKRCPVRQTEAKSCTVKQGIPRYGGYQK